VQGEPFVGVAGKRLNKWIEWMGLDRRACYILNTVMCRPPQNRNPLPMEIEACGAWFREQMTIVSAPVIVTLGKVAAHAILKSNRPMNKLRGHWHQSGYGKVRCTFHPAYIARRPDQEVGVFADLREVRAELDKHVASLGDAGEDQ
jgi:DNA polymerase